MNVAEPPAPAPWRIGNGMPMQRSFIDTNVLVYADSDDEPDKQRVVAGLIAHAIFTRTGVISTQVLNEYASVALRKLKLSHDRLREQLRFYKQFEVFSASPEITDTAVDLHQTRSISFFDALILASASVAGCRVLYSEDMNEGEVIVGVRIVNPFT